MYPRMQVLLYEQIELQHIETQTMFCLKLENCVTTLMLTIHNLLDLLGFSPAEY